MVCEGDRGDAVGDLSPETFCLHFGICYTLNMFTQHVLFATVWSSKTESLCMKSVKSVLLCLIFMLFEELSYVLCFLPFELTFICPSACT